VATDRVFAILARVVPVCYQRAMPPSCPQRDRSIDTLRGLSVLTMLSANMAAGVLAEPHPLWFRLVGSFAAPSFIFVSAMMVAYQARAGSHGFGYYLQRGLLTLGVGVLLDLALWDIVPGMTVDVLYLIGLALPLSFAFARLPAAIRWAAVLCIFACTPLLQQLLGYTDYPTEIHLWRSAAVLPEHPSPVLNHWLVDGWFPIFPWLGFSFLGVNLALLRPRAPGPEPGRGLGRLPWLAAALLLIGAGGAWFAWQPGPLWVREGYSELFYPPTLGYLIAATGVILLLLGLCDLRPGLAAARPLGLLGRAALFMYIAHLVLIEAVAVPCWPDRGIAEFGLVYAGLLGTLLLLGWAIQALKPRWPRRPFLVRFLLGG
jgi:uncharacterized membrane protein